MMNIVIDPRQMRKLESALGHIRNGVPKALVPAINRALAKGRTEVRREIRKEYLIKQKDIPVVVHRANKLSMKGDVELKQGMLPLAKFKVRPPGIQKRKHKRTIFAQVKRAGGGYIPHAFVTTSGGYTGPFMRYHGVGRLPIFRLSTIGAPIMASQPQVGPVVNKAMGDTLAKRIDHEIKRAMAAGGGHT
jgi:hypothetical protein